MKENKLYCFELLESFEKTILSVVRIEDSDNPSKIFERINNTGEKLSPADLIKNHIFFYSTNYDEDLDKFESEYEKIEEDIGSKQEDIASFYRYYSVICYPKSKLPSEGSKEIYNSFKKMCKGEYDFTSSKDVDNVLKKLKKHVFVWNYIHNFKSENPKINFFYQCFFNSKNTYYVLTHNLVLMVMKTDNNNYKIDQNDFGKIITIIAKFIFSLLISNKHEKTITRGTPKIYELFKEANKELSIESFSDWFEKEENLKLLTEEEIKTSIINTPIFLISVRKTKWLIMGIEQMTSKWESIIDINKTTEKLMTVEHIMPQSIENTKWMNDLLLNKSKEDASEWHEKWLNTLPNLTIVTRELNSKLSNASFDKKRKIYKEDSRFKINHIISNYENWHEKEIRDRANILSEKIWELFTMPK